VRLAGLAALMYGASNKEFFPAATSSTFGYHAVLVSQGYAQQALFYVKGGCPFGPTVFSNSTGDPLRAGSGTSTGADVRVSYGLNGYLQAGFGKPNGGPPYTQNGSTGASWCIYGPQRSTLGRVAKRPTYMMLTACSPTAWTSDTSTRETQFWPLQFIMGYTYSVGTFPIDPAKVRHEGSGLPITLADGHGTVLDPMVLTGGQTSEPLLTPLPWYLNFSSGLNVPVVSFTPLYYSPASRSLIGD
jgi:hypothetical protein